MHLLKSTLLVAVGSLMSLAAFAEPQAQQPPPSAAPQGLRPTPPPRRSPHEVVTGMIGDRRTGTRVMVVYGRPFSKDPRTGETRKIWGTLVPFGKVWRMGADEATLLLTPKPLVFGQVTVPAGVCTMFMLPAEDGTAKLIFNKQILQWGLQYDEPQDMGRVDMKKEALDPPVDQFTIAIENNPAGGGVLKLRWENTQYSVPFTVQQ